MYIIHILSCILVISVNLTNAESTADQCSKAMTALPPARDSNCCGIESSKQGKTGGGDIVDVRKYPWLAAIEYHKSLLSGEVEIQVRCAGALISGKFVLTAAHCLYNQDYWPPKYVLLGAFNISTTNRVCEPTSEGGQVCTDEVIVNPISKMIIHPEYEQIESKNDIALIKLTTTAPYTDFIRPICLPPMDYTVHKPDPFDLYFTGWGGEKQFHDGTKLVSNLKRRVQVPYVNNTFCEQLLSGTYRVITLTSGQLCAGGEDGKGACKGESGGPLMYKDQEIYDIVGVDSYGARTCGLINIPDVYTNVYMYIPWIRSTIEADSNST